MPFADKTHFFDDDLQNSSMEIGIGHQSLIIETGEELQGLADSCKQYKKRYCFNSLEKYMTEPANNIVCILYGLRRTGKTVMLCQLLNQLNLNTTLFVQMTTNDTMADLLIALKSRCKESKVETIIIDEATYAEDFTTSCAFLADTFAAKGIHVILAGTDSLGFYFAKGHQLYDRCTLIHTTFISFAEWSDLLGKDSIDEYIQYGGTLLPEGRTPFRSSASTQEYMNTAIAENIQNSLRILDRTNIFSNLRELYRRYQVTGLINRVLEDHNHDFTYEVANRLFTSHDLNSANDIITQHDLSDSLLNFIKDNKNSIIESLKDSMSISDSSPYNVTEYMLAEANTYLKELDLIDTFNIIDYIGAMHEHTVFTQPGLRYSQAQLLVKAIAQQNTFSNLSIKDRKLLQNVIMDDIVGRMLEELIIQHTIYALAASKQPIDQSHFIVFQYAFQNGEYDMVVLDSQDECAYIFEIKHSSRIDYAKQTRHLLNQSASDDFEKKYYHIKGRYVLYNGVDNQSHEVKYINASCYLRNINSFFE